MRKLESSTEPKLGNWSILFNDDDLTHVLASFQGVLIVFIDGVW